jgi:hypothetical protein
VGYRLRQQRHSCQRADPELRHEPIIASVQTYHAMKPCVLHEGGAGKRQGVLDGKATVAYELQQAMNRAVKGTVGT